MKPALVYKHHSTKTARCYVFERLFLYWLGGWGTSGGQFRAKAGTGQCCAASAQGEEFKDVHSKSSRLREAFRCGDPRRGGSRACTPSSSSERHPLTSVWCGRRDSGSRGSLRRGPSNVSADALDRANWEAVGYRDGHGSLGRCRHALAWARDSGLRLGPPPRLCISSPESSDSSLGT